MPKKRRSTRKLLDVNAKEINANLNKLTDRQAVAAFTESTRAGANVFKRKLAKTAPTSEINHRSKLNKSFTVKKKKFNKKDETGTWVLSNAPHAHLVEFGTLIRKPENPHWAWYEDEFHYVTFNGEATPNPFFRPVLESKETQAKAKVAMGQTLVKGIMRKIAKNESKKK